MISLDSSVWLVLLFPLLFFLLLPVVAFIGVHVLERKRR